MHRDFILDEAADSFGELAHECLFDLFSSDIKDELKEQDMTYLLYINQAFNQYSKLQRKIQKLKKNKTQPVMSLGKVDEKVAAAIKKFTSTDDMSDENSILCDASDVVLPMLHEVPKRSQDEQASAILNLMNAGYYVPEMMDAASYMHLFALANHRTIVKCPKLELEDDILLNGNELFTKLPLWSLCLDLTGCTMTNSEGETITGISIMRNPVGVGSQSKLNKAGKSKGNDAPAFLEDFVTIMLAINNSSFSIFTTPFLIVDDYSVEDMLLYPFTLKDTEMDGAESKSTMNTTAMELNEIKTSQGSAKIMIPVDVFESIKEAIKYVCYVLAHQNNIVDSQGKPAVLQNINLLSNQPNKSMSILGERSLPLNICTLQAPN